MSGVDYIRGNRKKKNRHSSSKGGKRLSLLLAVVLVLSLLTGVAPTAFASTEPLTEPSSNVADPSHELTEADFPPETDETGDDSGTEETGQVPDDEDETSQLADLETDDSGLHDNGETDTDTPQAEEPPAPYQRAMQPLAGPVQTVYGFVQLEAAVQNAEVSKINLGGNITMEHALTIDRPLSIYGNGYTLTAASGQRHFAFWLSGQDGLRLQSLSFYSNGPGGGVYLNEGIQLATVAYNANGGTGSYAEATAVGGAYLVLGDAATGITHSHAHYFLGWNTKADGSGNAYQPGSTIGTVNEAIGISGNGTPKQTAPETPTCPATT